jgi:eukaryotic-like serine/threonine-protein kinase
MRQRRDFQYVLQHSNPRSLTGGWGCDETKYGALENGRFDFVIRGDQVPDVELHDFEITQECPPRDARQIFHAVDRAQNKPVRLTVFSSDMSQRPEFRRALKTDRAMLSMLMHQSIVKFLGSGESDGQLFLWTEDCEFESLGEQLEHERTFSAEDVIEIGWQVCSALQQSHNLGLAHGGLTLDTVLLSDNMQAIVVDFGVARWMNAAATANASSDGPALITISALASRVEVERDLSSLAAILSRLLQAVTDTSEITESGKVSTKVALERLLVRVTSSNPALRPVSAREFQGRLGEILIGTEDDSMPLVDQRKSTTTSKRSIVVELFESTALGEPASPATTQSAGSAWPKQILPILFVVAIIVVITMLAGLLR